MARETAPSLRLVAHERVSTLRRGKSGLGLEAQRRAIDNFARRRGAQVIGRFNEVGSGRKSDRPKLGEALNLARLTGAIATSLIGDAQDLTGVAPSF